MKTNRYKKGAMKKLRKAMQQVMLTELGTEA